MSPLGDPPVLPGATFNLVENSPQGTLVGTVAGIDVDGDPLTYEIVGGNSAGAFAIDPLTGRISVANSVALDFEVTPVFRLIVEVRDPGGLTGNAAVTVNLTDVAETTQVVIDIAPGDPANRLTLNKRPGKYQLAIYCSPTFDVTGIDLDSLRFGRTGTEDSLIDHKRHGVQYELIDLNGDGRLDLLLGFEVSKTGLQAGDTVGILTGRLLDGTAFSAEDDVLIG